MVFVKWDYTSIPNTKVIGQYLEFITALGGIYSILNTMFDFESIKLYH